MLKELRTNKIKGVVFDLDGTLIDSKNDILLAFAFAFQNIGREKPADELLIHTIGARLEECFRPFLGDDENLLKDAAKFFREYYEKNFLDKTVPFEGINTLLREIKKTRKLAIVTMKKGIYARKIVEHFFSSNLFDSVVGAEEGLKAKPHPEMLEKAVADLGLNKDEIVYVGDTLVDLKMAKNANVNFVFVKWGYGKSDGEEENIKLVSNPSELLLMLNYHF